MVVRQVDRRADRRVVRWVDIGGRRVCRWNSDESTGVSAIGGLVGEWIGGWTGGRSGGGIGGRFSGWTAT